MFKTTVVIWLVLLVLALSVVAFLTRLIEKRRPVHQSSRFPERTVSVDESSRLSILKNQADRLTGR